MATEDINIVDPDNGEGTSYTSLNLWEDGEDANIVTADIIAVAKCRCTGGTADTTAVTVDGWTTDSTRYIKIWTDTAESYRHSGVWATGNKYRLVVSNAAVIRILEPDAKVEGIQISKGGNSGTYGVFYNGASGSTNVKIGYCIIRNEGTDGVSAGVHHSYDDSSGALTIYNTIFYDFSTADGYGIEANTFRSMVALNCTFHNCTIGAKRNFGTLTLKNCLFASCTSDASGTISDTYCSTTNDNTKGLTSGGTGNRFSQTFTFVDESGDNFHLASNDAGAKGYGANLTSDADYPFTTDIDGDTRPSSGAWCIGADEYIAATGGPVIPVFAYYYGQMRIK